MLNTLNSAMMITKTLPHPCILACPVWHIHPCRYTSQSLDIIEYYRNCIWVCPAAFRPISIFLLIFAHLIWFRLDLRIILCEYLPTISHPLSLLPYSHSDLAPLRIIVLDCNAISLTPLMPSNLIKFANKPINKWYYLNIDVHDVDVDVM